MAIMKHLAVLLPLAILQVLAFTPPPGFEMEDIQWDVTSSTGETLTVNGTIQQVHQHMRRVDPGWESDFDKDNNATQPLGSELTKRKWDKNGDNWPPWTTMWCGEDPGYGRGRAWVTPIKEGVAYLVGLSEKAKKGKQANPKAGPGPKKCGQVSCSYDSSIVWCNEDNKPKELQSWKRIAHGAAGILEWCSEGKVVEGRVRCVTDKVSVQVTSSWC